MGEKIIRDAEYMKYIEDGDSAAVLAIKGSDKLISNSKTWIDIEKHDGCRERDNMWTFSKIKLSIFKRTKNPHYTPAMNERDRQYETWKTANEDIAQQRSKGVKGTRYTVSVKSEWIKTEKRYKYEITSYNNKELDAKLKVASKPVTVNTKINESFRYEMSGEKRSELHGYMHKELTKRKYSRDEANHICSIVAKNINYKEMLKMIHNSICGDPTIQDGKKAYADVKDILSKYEL